MAILMTEKVNILFNEVSSMLGNRKIFINAVGRDKLSPVAGAQVYTSTANKDIIIDIQDDIVSEELITHELLHIYFDQRGYPHVFANNRMPDIINNTGFLLHNAVIHKFILEEQVRRGIDITGVENSYLKSIPNWINENDMTNTEKANCIAKQLTFLIMARERKDEMLGLFKNKYPTINYLFLKLYDIVTKSYCTPFESRRTIVKLYKAFDEVAYELGLPPMLLNKCMMLQFIPSLRQLDLNVSQVFRLASLPNRFFFLETIADGQNTLYINEDEMDNLSDYKLKDFFDFKGLTLVIKG